MNTWIKKPLLITLSLALFCAALPGRAQDSPQGSDRVQFVTGDAGGDAIPIARLTAEHGWEVTPDTDGHAEIEYEPNSSFGISVRVSAPDPQLWHADQSDIIYMEKETNRLVRSASTVSVHELCPAVQQRSQKLQREALEALQRGEHEVALQLLSEALHLTPSTGGLYNNVGFVHMLRKNVEQAAEWFEKAAKVSPYDPTIQGNLGLIRHLQHRDHESYRLLDRAVACGYSSPMAHYVLGVMALHKQRFAKAVNNLRKTDPSRFYYRDLYLSIGQRGLGKLRAADRTFQSFVKNYKAPLAVIVTAGFRPGTNDQFPARSAHAATGPVL